MWLGKGLEHSSFWSASSMLILGSACEHSARGTEGNRSKPDLQALLAWGSLRAPFPLSHRMRNGMGFLSFPQLRPGLVPDLPEARRGWAGSSYFRMQCCSWQGRRSTTGSMPNPTSCKELRLPPPTHAKLFFSPQGKLDIVKSTKWLEYPGMCEWAELTRWWFETSLVAF